jgi:hypothetical protein
MPFSYSARQRYFYRHRASLFSPQADANLTTGVVAGDDWTFAVENVLCHFEIRPHFDDYTVFGRYESDNMFTLDVLHLPVDCPIGADWFVLNLTTDAVTGGPANEYGNYSRVRGAPRNIANAGPRRFGKRSAFIFGEVPPRELLEMVEQP